MKKRLLSIFFITAAVMIACSTGDPLVNEAENQIKSANFDAAIEAAEQALENNPQNPLAYYFKGVALGSKAEDVNPPSDRKNFFEEMRESFDQALEFGELAEERPDELDNIENVITTVWASEHNAAVQMLTDDSVRAATPDPAGTAIAHLENAITIQPDSALSYIVLSSANFQEGNVEEAISTYETAMSLLTKPEVEDYDYLISLYLNQRKFEDARELSEEAVDTYPDETNFVRYLADAYLQTGNTEKAMEVVNDLIESDPENPQYRMVLGTQVYQQVTDMNDEISSMYTQLNSMERQVSQLSGSEQEEVEQNIAVLESEIEELEAESERLTQIAIDAVEKTTELDPQNDNAHNVLGIIYQNKAAILFEKRNSIVDNNELASQYDQEAREALQNSMTYYEKATEINPDNAEYWEALFQVYTTLGMDEKAREAMEKAGIE